MSVHYSPDLAALAARPDFEVSLPKEPDVSPVKRLSRVAVTSGIFLATTFAIAVVFFVPVFAFNLSRVEALEIAGEYLSVASFAEQLSSLFLGTLILALAFTSFVASLLLFAAGATVRPKNQTVVQDDAMTHLTVLRLSGHER
jgi:hypothetical protein